MMNLGWQLSIDYGTSNTVAVLRWPDGKTRPLLFDSSPLTPSAVYLADNRLLVGRDAERSLRLDPACFEGNPKRRIDEHALLLGGRSVPVVDAIAATLRRVRDEATRTAGRPPTRTVLAYPATWASQRRSILLKAASMAALSDPVLVPEPVAAASYFATILGQRLADNSAVVVYDLGAGTFDVSVVRRRGTELEVATLGGLPDFGGLDLDHLVLKHVARYAKVRAPEVWQRLSTPQNAAELRQWRLLWDDARGAKEMLSRRPSASISIPLGEFDVLITRDEFEAAAYPMVEATATLTGDVLRRAQVAPTDLAGLFLVGGSSRVPLVASTLHRIVGVPPTALEQPELVVAEGALHAPQVTSTSTVSDAPARGRQSTAPTGPEIVPTSSMPRPPHEAESKRSKLLPALTLIAVTALVAIASVYALWARGSSAEQGRFTDALEIPCDYLDDDLLYDLLTISDVNLEEAKKDGHPTCNARENSPGSNEVVLKIVLQRFTAVGGEDAPAKAKSFFNRSRYKTTEEVLESRHDNEVGDEARYWRTSNTTALWFLESNLVVTIWLGTNTSIGADDGLATLARTINKNLLDSVRE